MVSDLFFLPVYGVRSHCCSIMLLREEKNSIEDRE